jgi:hypothetical protein
MHLDIARSKKPAGISSRQAQAPSKGGKDGYSMAQKLSRRNRKIVGIRIKPKEGLWIIYQLRLKGIKQSDLCRKLGVKSSSVSQVLSGVRRSNRIEETLYQTLGYTSFEAMIAASRGKGEAV